MLTDVLGLVIAFSVVMLLLSLMVTSLGQATQHAFRLRSRNLQNGVAAAINQTSSEDAATSKQIAAELMNSVAVTPLGGATKPNSGIAKYRGPEVTWVDPEALKKAFSEISNANGIEPDKVADLFKKSDLPLKKRFSLTMRIVSFFWALVIACVFQISTPALVEQLSVDPVLRQQIASRADEVIVYASGKLEQIDNDAEVYSAVVQSMVHKYPDLKKQFEGLDTDTAWLGDLSEELADVIETDSRADAIVESFEDALSAAYKKASDKALDSAKSTANQLSMINITPFRYGRSFYNSAENLIGLLMTVILLSLGAPFWFNTLKTAVSFRDLLQPRPPKDSDDKSSDDMNTNKNKNGGGGNE